MTDILMVASEATPFAKTGGLADVVGALPKALQSLGDKVAVVLPLYRETALQQARVVYRDLPVWLGHSQFRVDFVEALDNGVSFYFVDCPPLFDRPGIYNDGGRDYPDNHIRFAVLCQAALGVVRHLFRPQVIHCHDWQSALVAPYIRHLFRGDPAFLGLKLLLTIHNLGYQGIFAPAAARDIGLEELFHADGLEFSGDVNLLKGGIIWSDAINTVSKGYAREIQTSQHGFGLDALLRSRRNVLTGILNGVDYTEWNPETDRYIPANYSSGNLSGKRINKKRLLENFGLPVDRLKTPVLGIVSRFATQKGFDLLAEIAADLAAEDLCITALGNGEAEYEALFRDLAAAFPDKIGVRIGWDDALAHLIEAGADMFLMPSHYEPCGLNQIYSMRYGTVPIVRATGGLDDTIHESTGFKFKEYSGPALLETIRRALTAFESDKWQPMMRKGMQQDFSWSASAPEYSALYRQLCSKTISNESKRALKASS